MGEGAGFALGVSRRLTNGPSTFTGSTTTDDLFIGAPNYQIQVANQWTNKSNLPGQNQSNFPDSSWVSAGAVYVFNSNQGLSSNATPWATYTGPTIPNAQGTATSYFAGTVIGSGLNTDFTDYDGDGRQDLVIAGPGANTNTGQAYLLSGAGATKSTNLQALNTVSNLVINGGLAGGKTGAVITSPGDLNDDGYQDFLITAPQGANATGQSYVLFGPLDLSQFGTIFDLNVTANDNKTTFLLNGNQPYQATGTAAVGVGDINNDGIDDLMLTAPVAQQLYAVYGHPWLADDGSIKLSDVSSNNGFVIDGYEYSLPSSLFGYVLTFDLGYGANFELTSALLQLISPTGQVIWRSNPGVGVTVTPEAYAIMQSDGNFVVYGQPGNNPGDVIWSSNTSGNSGAVLKLAADGGLYIVDSEGNVVPNGTLHPGNTSLISTAVTLEENQEINIKFDTFLANGENGGSLFGNGLNVVMVGDVNGDGFADVISGGSPAGGVLIFGNSTKDLLDAALGTDDLIISVENAQVKEFVALGDFNGDGLADFGAIDQQDNFYLILGSPELGGQGSLIIDSTLPNLSNFNQAWGVGDFNGDGYDDFVLQGPNSTSVVYGNANGTLTDSSSLTFGNSFPLPSSFTGIDLNGNGIREIIAGQPKLNPVANIGGFGGGIQYFTYESGNPVLQPTVNPPNASVTAALGLLPWGQISFPNQYAQSVTSFAILDGWLYQAFYGINERISTKDSYIYIQRSRDGVNWENLTQVVPLDSNGTPIDLKNLPPSITAYNGTLYLGFTADNGQVWVAEGVNTNANAGIRINAVPINQTSNNGPTLVAFNDELYVFFVKDNSDDLILYSSSSNPGSSSGWDNGNTVLTFNGVAQSTNQPLSAIVVPGSDGDTLAVAFRSNNSAAAWTSLLNSSDLTNWQGSAELNQVDTNSQVSLTVVDGTYYLFFTTSNGDSFEYITSTDGLNWGDTASVPDDENADLNGLSSVLFNQSFIISLNEKDIDSLLFAFSDPLFDPNQVSRWGEQVQDIGDFNGDGIADLAVLAPGYRNLLQLPIFNYPTINNLGGVFIYYGEEGGISVNNPPDVVLAAPDLPNETIFELLEITPISDVNGDGFDDLLISAPLTPVIAGQFPDVNGDQGVSWVVFGGTHWGNEYTANSPFGLGNLANNQTNNTQNFNPYGFVTTGLPSSQAGISISGGADINGDSFSDFALGAPGNFDNLNYVLFGSDFTSQVNQLGTIGDDVMLGSPTGEIFVAGQGDDQIYTKGGVDTVYAGPGDDFVTVTDTNFRRLDGGSGNNILKFTGYTNQNWDLTTLSPGLRLKNFNILDVRNYGANILTLNALTITQLSANNEIRVLLDANDKLNLDPSFNSPSEKVYLDNQNYYRYTSSASAATVLVNVPNQVTFTALSTNTPILNTIPTAQASALSTDNNASSLTGATLVTTASTDPPQPTRLFVSNPTVAEAAGVATFTIQRTGDLNKYVAVNYRTQDGSGKAGDRYLPNLGRFVFAPQEASKTITIDLPNDAIYTGTKTFGLQVSLLVEADTGETLPLEFEAEAAGEGGQIRGWRLEEQATNNGVLGGALQFEVTSTEGQAQVSLSLDGLPDFNSYYSYSPQTDTYQELLFDGSTGASFRSDQGHTVQLVGQDGERGDSDDVPNGLVQVHGYVGRTIPGLVSQDHRIFWAPTLADGQGQWRLIGTSSQDYELGWIAVDDLQGTIDGLLPSDPNYQALALGRKQVLFHNKGGAAPQALSRQIALEGFVNADNLAPTEEEFFGELQPFSLAANRYHILYARQGESLTFSLTEPPQIVNDSRGYHQLSFGGITAEMSSSTVFIPGPWNERVSVQASLSRAADYENVIALYPVDTLTGGLTLLGPEATDPSTLYPGDPGYAQVALERARNPVTGVILNTPSNLATNQQRLELQGNTLYGMVIVPNTTLEAVLNQNPNNLPGSGPVALFSFGAANPDGRSHMARLGSNLFGFEDIWGGGDQDYNDMVLRLVPQIIT